MTTILTIPSKVPSNNGKNGLLRMHWSKRGKLRDTWTWLFLAQTHNRHKGRVTVRFIHYYTGAPISDADNLSSTSKIPLDAMKKAGIILDDKMTIIGVPTFLQVRVKSKDQEKTVIEITDVED